MKATSMGRPAMGAPGCSCMNRRASAVLSAVGPSNCAGIGYGLADTDDMAGVNPPGDHRLDGGAVDGDDVVVVGIGLAGLVSPPIDSAVEGVAGGGVGAAADEVVGGLVGVDVADASPALDGHVADREAALHRHVVDHVSAVFVAVADTAVDPEAADDAQDHVLGVDATAQAAVDLDAADFWLLDRHTPGGEHIAHLRGANAEGDRSEGAVGAGVAVATGDGHARLGEAQLRANDMHDALASAGFVEELDAAFTHVALDLHEHLLGHGVKQRPVGAVGGNDVVDGGEGAAGIADAEAALAEHAEGLRAGDLMDQVQPDEELGLAGGELADGVSGPDLVQQCFSHAFTFRGRI